uniref:Carboxylic ester hydrolase n=1 Tax=Timema shepardi TaxID=629360 RepID=A0A7R9AMR7_TIMSH|nr:unnamed protein product [Timema shepardi]
MAELVTVKVSEGIVRGKRSTTKNGGTYYSFQGVPYANPPVGARRFKPPETPDSWNGVRDALCLGSPCSQINKFTGKMDGSEDCLYLNVYTTELLPPNASSRAVLVFIHGGGFVWGSGGTDFYGPDLLMSSDVVLVTFNYRLGVLDVSRCTAISVLKIISTYRAYLGFLRLDGSDVSPNNGMKDQVAVLRWVSRNIAKFGGDPHNVTIFGESAGGVCVNYHLLSPLSKGLFHKAIAMSGSVYCSWALDRSCHGRARRLGEELGCHSDNPQSLAEFLRTVPVTQLVMAQSSMLSDKDTEKLYAHYNQSSDSVISTLPLCFVRCAVNHENICSAFQPRVSLCCTFPACNEKCQDFKSFCCPSVEPQTPEAFLPQDPELMCDKLISYGVHKMVAELFIRSSQPVFYYQFSYDGDWGFLQALGERAPGPDEVTYEGTPARDSPEKENEEWVEGESYFVSISESDEI